MFSEDLHEKQEHRRLHIDEGRYENKCILSPKKRIYAREVSKKKCNYKFWHQLFGQGVIKIAGFFEST